jgi:hypothetical protein
VDTPTPPPKRHVGWESFARDKHSNLLWKSINYG